MYIGWKRQSSKRLFKQNLESVFPKGPVEATKEDEPWLSF